jgi:hypothetical protein
MTKTIYSYWKINLWKQFILSKKKSYINIDKNYFQNFVIINKKKIKCKKTSTTLTQQNA